MGSFRKSLPFLGFMLLAVLVPVQAAGCCKWSALLGWAAPAERSAQAAQDPAGMSPGHACCPKPAPPGEDPASAPASPDCGSGGEGCCLEAAPATGPALASVPAAFAGGPALLLPLPSGEGPRVAPVLPSRTAPEASGPPAYLAQLRLLI